MTPFEYIRGPFYVYILQEWVGSQLVPFYVGRGRKRRAKSYYNRKRYLEAPTHNPDVTRRVRKIRSCGKEVAIIASDCGGFLEYAKSLERALISEYGRLENGTGTLLNRNGGG